MSTLFQAEQLRPWLQAGPAPLDLSVFGGHPAVLLELASVPGFGRAADLARWLPTLACPVIGVRDPDDASCRQPDLAGVASACDTVVDGLGPAGQLHEKIAEHPVAAASLVELLRVTESMPLMSALSVESSVYAALQGGAEYARWLAGRGEQPAAPRDPGPPVIQTRDRGRLELLLNRPSNRNAMSVEMRDALVEALRLVCLDDQIREVRLSGAGRSFSTGGDLREFGSVPDPASGHLIRLLSVPGKFLAPVADRVTAHLHGACVGSGIEFPAFAGRVVARSGTWFQLPEIGMGLIPGAGGCISIARRIGRQRLAWWALSGRRIRAGQALAWGLIDEIADD